MPIMIYFKILFLSCRKKKPSWSKDHLRCREYREWFDGFLLWIVQEQQLKGATTQTLEGFLSITQFMLADNQARRDDFRAVVVRSVERGRKGRENNGNYFKYGPEWDDSGTTRKRGGGLFRFHEKVDVPVQDLDIKISRLNRNDWWTWLIWKALQSLQSLRTSRNISIKDSTHPSQIYEHLIKASGVKNASSCRFLVVRRNKGFNPMSQFAYSLHLWCLNPAVVLREVREDCRSIVVTSGTLSPLSSYQSELDIDFKVSFLFKRPLTFLNIAIT